MTATRLEDTAGPSTYAKKEGPTNTFRDKVEEETTAVRATRKDIRLRAKRALASIASREQAKMENALLKPGDLLRAKGFIYRVRKVTPKDFVLRLCAPGGIVPKAAG